MHITPCTKQFIAVISDEQLFDLFQVSLADGDKLDRTLRLAQYLTNLLIGKNSSLTHYL
jgi:hypothetical protein